ncbi:hypothetical protein ASPZODRAFT_132361 [Penicilliopsis zonata CBS 506.65]|uniref:Uncharacterized protein n=1 Tax=Penicilliopsis zonata CBS 506.65 TaxID=1073090 RepID=A0A1L9SJW1_9EURO|nr:hypothetical protein ASPZODRAFT_132361 [Penicilliopsis zonata CBS 506.65]OJJ47376.1 hypothetical protein ASPZODRAFT_132361 [Penicilliopsis zonata CBS 506.65]
MSSASPQADIGSLSLASLGAFSTILTALSADDVQPIAMIQLQNLGAAFPLSGPVTVTAPDYLQRFQSTRIERLGIAVGWRKGDSASLMAQSTGGQAIALLSVCLSDLFNKSVGDIFFALSKALLPQSGCISSPRLLQRAAQVLADKLAVIGFGNIIAKQVCRIHEVYKHLKNRTPRYLLGDISADWMGEVLVLISHALREDNGLVRIRGCDGMGYVMAIMVTLFADDTLVTIEGFVVHKGSRSSSVLVEIVESMADDSIEVHKMRHVDSMYDLFHDSSAVSATPSLFIPNFAWKELIPSLLAIGYMWCGLASSPEVLRAIGVCALSAVDQTDIITSSKQGEVQLPVTELLGEQYHTLMHQRCEVLVGLSLPQTWPSYSVALSQLDNLIKQRLEDSGHDFDDITSVMESGKLLKIIWLMFVMLFVNAHPNTTWKYAYSQNEMDRPRDWGDAVTSRFEIEPHSIWTRLHPRWERRTVASSDRKATLVPSPCFTLWENENICQYRGLELLDGPLMYNGRYHDSLTDENDFQGVNNMFLPHPLHPSGPIVPCADGVHSDLSLLVSERSDGLSLRAIATRAGKRYDVGFAGCLTNLFEVLKAKPCAHPRNTPLKREYESEVIIRNMGDKVAFNTRGDRIAISQTAGNPVAQFLCLAGEPALLCYKCCLNCAYEQARTKNVDHILVG